MTKSLTPDGFAARFKKASRKLWCLAAAILGGPALAEDILQEAAITGLSRLADFDPETNFDAWMGQIVRYTALNQSRRHYRSHEFGVDDLSSSPGPRATDPATVDDWGQLLPDQEHFDDSVVRALRQLEPTPRACFLLRTLMNMPYREVADLLSIPEGTAMSHVHRSRAALRQSLEADVSFEPLAGWREA